METPPQRASAMEQQRRDLPDEYSVNDPRLLLLILRNLMEQEEDEQRRDRIGSILSFANWTVPECMEKVESLEKRIAELEKQNKNFEMETPPQRASAMEQQRSDFEFEYEINDPRLLLVLKEAEEDEQRREQIRSILSFANWTVPECMEKVESLEKCDSEEQNKSLQEKQTTSPAAASPPPMHGMAEMSRPPMPAAPSPPPMPGMAGPPPPPMPGQPTPSPRRSTRTKRRPRYHPENLTKTENKRTKPGKMS